MRTIVIGAALACIAGFPVFAQTATEQTSPAVAADMIPGQEILTEALEKGGFTNVRVVGQGFSIMEATAPEGGTVYLMVSKDGSAITAGGGQAAPEFTTGAGAGGASAPGAAKQ